MRIINVLFVGVIATSHSGCANFDPTLNGLITISSSATQSSPAVNRAAAPNSIAAATSSNINKCTILPNHKSKFDVDTLYGRAMSRFGFKSPEQITIYHKLISDNYSVDQRYKHEKQSGAFYHLAQTVSYTAAGEKRAIWLELKFSKNGTGSDVSAEFCVNPADPMGSSNNTHQKISARIQEIFSG